MKKITKAILILSLLLFLAGGGCLIAGCIMGITSGDLMNALKKLPIIDFGNQLIITEDNTIRIPSIDGGDLTADNTWNYQKEDVQNIRLEIASANVTIRASEDEWIYVTASDPSRINTGLINGTLTIEKDASVLGDDDGSVDIYLPMNCKLNRFELQAGTGNIVIDCHVQADIFKVEAGASAVSAYNTITAGEVDIDLGAGKASFELVDAEDIQISNGAGQTEIGLAGQKERYHVTIDSAAGTVRYGAETFSGVANTYSDQPKDADRSIKIESALGEVIVHFEEVI